MGQPGMGQAGMTGAMGMGGMNSGLGAGMGSYGMNRGMNQGMGQANQQSPAGQIQWVSNAAMNAVAMEQSSRISALRIYAKDMVIVLVVTPILLVLAISGSLMNLGFLLGDLLVNAVSNIGGML